MKFIILGEVHIYEIQEFSADVCRDVFAEGGVEPNDFSIFVALPILVLSTVLLMKNVY